MKNNKKNDSISVNQITGTNHTEKISDKPEGNAAKNTFCIYNNKRHAVGSIIKFDDGSEAICSERGTWENK